MKYFPIKDLKRADYNPRKISDREMESLMLSIKTHGFVEPIVINVYSLRRGTIVGGHQRLTAVEKLLEKGEIVVGLKNEGTTEPKWSIPVFEVNLDIVQEKELNIALNKIHGEFDEMKLSDLLVSLKDSPTINSTGFSGDDLASILGPAGAAAEMKKAHPEGCARCDELRRQLAGHEHKSGHKINFNNEPAK